ncbi:MAG: AAA family ATPase [Treponema sp.]|nr:AAA family ATPase [Treponema sp.]
MTVDTKQLTYILDHTPASQNIMLVGKHGIGKSRILEDYFSEKGAKVVTLFLGQMSDPGDLIGLPEKNEKTGKTDFMLPYWFPLDNEPVVLFLDELNRARPEVLQTIMDLTLNRKLAGKSLPEGSRIISAVNKGNEYQLTDLDPALVSRFNIYDFQPSVEDWLAWGQNSGIDPRILSFINDNPEYLDSDEDQGLAENLERFPDRRSWERTSQIIKDFDQLTDLQKPLVSGILGNKASALFFRHASQNDFPSAKDLLTSTFSDFIPKLEKLDAPKLSLLNTGLLKFIESKSYNQTEEEKLPQNLELYFDYLEQLGHKELQAQFVSLLKAEKYPESLYFISTKAPGLYKKLFDLVSNM